jgi:hypothetical protein
LLHRWQWLWPLQLLLHLVFPGAQRSRYDTATYVFMIMVDHQRGMLLLGQVLMLLSLAHFSTTLKLA